jgi:Zn-dependent protease with chaperone function
MADINARLHDGEVALTRHVRVEVTGSSAENGALVIRNRAGGEILVRWPRHALYAVTATRNLLRIGTSDGAHENARLTIEGPDDVAALYDALPTLKAKQIAHRGAQGRTLMLATAALGSVIGAFVLGVPLIASQIVDLIPTAWERDFGDRIVGQVEDVMTDGRGALARCDTAPGSLANQAIARFVGAATEGLDTSVKVRVAVVRNPVPNAFALPGGQVYYFSSLLAASPDRNAFAGVLAHEMGHAIERHGMEQVVATAGTGLLVGLVVGDVFGISPALFVGQQIINSRFSRVNELAADRFALNVAQRLKFDPAPMADLLQTIAADSAGSRAMSLVASHPLTDEREAFLKEGATAEQAGSSFFSDSEWAAIRAMCQSTAARNRARNEAQTGSPAPERRPAETGQAPAPTGNSTAPATPKTGKGAKNSKGSKNGS